MKGFVCLHRSSVPTVPVLTSSPCCSSVRMSIAARAVAELCPLVQSALSVESSSYPRYFDDLPRMLEAQWERGDCRPGRRSGIRAGNDREHLRLRLGHRHRVFRQGRSSWSAVMRAGAGLPRFRSIRSPSPMRWRGYRSAEGTVPRRKSSQELFVFSAREGRLRGDHNCRQLCRVAGAGERQLRGHVVVDDYVLL